MEAAADDVEVVVDNTELTVDDTEADTDEPVAVDDAEAADVVNVLGATVTGDFCALAFVVDCGDVLG